MHHGAHLQEFAVTVVEDAFVAIVIVELLLHLGVAGHPPARDGHYPRLLPRAQSVAIAEVPGKATRLSRTGGVPKQDPEHGDACGDNGDGCLGVSPEPVHRKRVLKTRNRVESV